ncbi:MAG TPA: hypothetical protein VFU63_11125, partial [Ktedonobacterales bacterium]|nr:hypothetical protein [Ktedonobacterales bacterium]
GNGGGSGWNPRTLSPTAADAAGSYHLLARVRSAQTSGNLPNISLRVATAQQTDSWINRSDSTDIVGEWEGPYVYPFSASNTWTIADAGQCVLPPFPQGALTDPAKLYLTPRAQWQDTSASSSASAFTNWQALLPVDGSLLVATINNPANSAGAISNLWLWTYADGLLVNRGGAADGPAWLYSREANPIPNAAQGAGGAGTQGSGAINVNSGADPYLTLDPTLAGNNSATGVNQMVAILSDQIGTVLPCYTEISYAPLYLEPR